MALDTAIDAGKIKYNPILGVRLGHVEDKGMRGFTVEEYEAVCRAALQATELHAFGIVFALSTGVHEGELLALKWFALIEREKAVVIKRAVARITTKDPIRQKPLGKKTEIRIGPPKTKKPKRKIALFDQLWEDLMAYKEKQQLFKLVYGETYEDEGWVFCSPLGKIMEPGVYQDLFKRGIDAAEIDDANFHATRHTFATRALENGMDIKLLPAILGHAQTSTALNRYGHALPEHVKASMDKMKPAYADMKAEFNDSEAGTEQEGIQEKGDRQACQIIHFGSISNSSTNKVR